MTKPITQNETAGAGQEQAHTLGPWTYFVGNTNGRGLIRIEQQDTGVRIASLPRGSVGKTNAALITAAPDLLASLREAAEKENFWHGQYCAGSHYNGECDCWVSRARAAIAKATA